MNESAPASVVSGVHATTKIAARVITAITTVASWSVISGTTNMHGNHERLVQVLVVLERTQEAGKLGRRS